MSDSRHLSPVVSINLKASLICRRASSNWPNLAHALAKWETYDGINTTEPLDCHAAMPAGIMVIACMVTGAPPIRGGGGVPSPTCRQERDFWRRGQAPQDVPKRRDLYGETQEPPSRSQKNRPKMGRSQAGFPRRVSVDWMVQFRARTWDPLIKGR